VGPQGHLCKQPFTYVIHTRLTVNMYETG
jgi:hypothetical protein